MAGDAVRGIRAQAAKPRRLNALMARSGPNKFDGPVSLSTRPDQETAKDFDSAPVRMRVQSAVAASGGRAYHQRLTDPQG